MKSLISYLDCGRYKQPSGYDSGEFIVQMFSDLDEKIIPFFEKYPLVGDKLQDFSYFKIAAEIIKVKGHLTEEGLEKIRAIKVGMNRGRNKRTPKFTIGLHANDLALLERIAAQFGVGNISINSNNLIRWHVSSVKDLVNVIIPFFEKYPLISQKRG